MSPEQAEGMVAELDTRSDIYSLGGILYAILTLRPPVGGSTLAEVLRNVKSGVLSPMGTATRMAKGIGGRPEPMTLAVEREFRVHDSEVRNLDWHPTLPVLATLGRNEVRLWDVKSGRMLEEIRLKKEGGHLRFVADGRRLLVDWMLFEPKACAP